METGHIIHIYYLYTRIADPKACADWVRAQCIELGMTGRILVASEGINGTAEGTTENINEFERRMHAQDGSPGTFADFSKIWFKQSAGTGDAFKKLKVKVRNEIVTLGLKDEDFDPNETTGTYLTPEQLKAWLDAGEDIEIVDMRNDYEFKVGYFRGSKPLPMENFRDLPGALPLLEPIKNKKVVTVCTYGVRCEKASGYLKRKGFENVYQLHGGIGSYMKTYPGKDFLGSLYVFDRRILEQDAPEYEKVGRCEKCGTTSERFTNCALDDCHAKIIVCESCETAAGRVYCKEVCRQIHDTQLSSRKVV